MLNNRPNVQECDARMMHKVNDAGNKNCHAEQNVLYLSRPHEQLNIICVEIY